MDFGGFYFITDGSLTKNGILKDAEDAIRGGATVIQYREKSKDTDPMVEEALKLKKICAGKALLIVNDRVDVALASGADGVHLGQTDMAYKDARRLLGNRIIGVTVHNIEEAKRAEAMGADYLGLSPIFKTGTKKDAGPAAGLDFVRQVSESVTIPTVAIGGITPKNARDVMKAGATTLCAISATAGEDVELKVREFTKIIKSGPQ